MLHQCGTCHTLESTESYSVHTYTTGSAPYEQLVGQRCPGAACPPSSMSAALINDLLDLKEQLT